MSKEKEKKDAPEVSPEIQAAVDAAKTGLKEAKAKLARFYEKNELAPDAEIGDIELSKKARKLISAVEEAEKVYKKAKKGMKPGKDRTPRESKYDYPAGLDSLGKKKFRQEARKEAKKAEKEASGEKAPKKKAKPEEEPAKASSKKKSKED